LSTSISTATPGQGGPADPAARKKRVANELARLTATALHNSAVAAVIAGVVGPAASDFYGITTPRFPYWREFGIAWLMAAAVLHPAARTMLEDLEP
jgi:hypothetical protein